MTTFSQMVDDMVAESRRKDMQLDIEKYINQTIRDVHFNDQNTGLVKFADNRNEMLVYADSELSFIWPIVQPQNFAKIEAIYCPFVGAYAKLRNPSQTYVLSNLQREPLWYRTGPNIAIEGFGGIDAPLQIAWFSYPRRLTYAIVANRTCMWDEANQDYVYASSVVTPEDMEAARASSTNWLLERWPDLIREGLRAKLYKKLNDENRTRTAYSAFESARRAMVAAESFDSEGTYLK